MPAELSIIVPVLNDIRVGRALDSINTQRPVCNVELIVVDGGSDQPTLDEIQKRQDRISRLISEPDEGIYDAMNKGIDAATGDIVGILNADDRYADQEVFGRVLSALDDDAVGACYSDMIYVNDEGHTTRRWKAGKEATFKWYLGWMPPHPTFFVRRDLYQRHGTFRKELTISADYELMLRLTLKHGTKLKYIPTCNVHMTPGGHSSKNLQAIVKANMEARRAWRMNGLRWGTLVPLLKPARKLLQFGK